MKQRSREILLAGTILPWVLNPGYGVAAETATQAPIVMAQAAPADQEPPKKHPEPGQPPHAAPNPPALAPAPRPAAPKAAAPEAPSRPAPQAEPAPHAAPPAPKAAAPEATRPAPAPAPVPHVAPPPAPAPKPAVAPPPAPKAAAPEEPKPVPHVAPAPAPAAPPKSVPAQPVPVAPPPKAAPLEPPKPAPAVPPAPVAAPPAPAAAPKPAPAMQAPPPPPAPAAGQPAGSHALPVPGASLPKPAAAPATPPAAVAPPPGAPAQHPAATPAPGTAPAPVPQAGTHALPVPGAPAAQPAGARPVPGQQGGSNVPPAPGTSPQPPAAQPPAAAPGQPAAANRPAPPAPPPPPPPPPAAAPAQPAAPAQGGAPQPQKNGRRDSTGAVIAGAAAGFVGGFLAAQGLDRIDQVRGARQEFTDDGVEYIREPGRTIVREDDRFYIAHDENQRFRDLGFDVQSQRQGAYDVSFYDRPDGSRIYTYTDDEGRLVRRVRQYPDGREVFLIDNRFGGPNRDFQADVVVLPPPPPMDLPPDRYVVDASRADEQVVYDTLIAPPVAPISRRYTLDQIRYSPDLRARMRSVDLNTITFDTGSWTVAPQYADRLAVLARAINQAVSRNPQEVYMVEGYTDAVGNDVDNLSLSDRRAQSVAAILTRNFQVPAENLVTQGYGEQFLKVQTREASVENRRVTLRRITPLLAQQGQ